MPGQQENLKIQLPNCLQGNSHRHKIRFFFPFQLLKDTEICTGCRQGLSTATETEKTYGQTFFLQYFIMRPFCLKNCRNDKFIREEIHPSVSKLCVLLENRGEKRCVYRNKTVDKIEIKLHLKPPIPTKCCGGMDS